VDHLLMVDVIVSLNAVLIPDPNLRMSVLQGMASRLNPGGHLILNVPSVESLLYSYFRETEWYRKEGSSPHKAEKQVDASYIIQPKRIGQGICIFISHLTPSPLSLRKPSTLSHGFSQVA